MLVPVTKVNEKVNRKCDEKNRADVNESNPEFWREFLGEVIPELYGMFMKQWPNPSIAEELVQKTVFDVCKAKDSYDAEKGSLKQWMFGIARNNIRLEIRKRASRPSFNGDLSDYIEQIDTEILPDEILERKETADAVKKALGRLDEKEQMVLKNKYIEGMSAAQIAELTGGTEKAVHSLLYRARISFRNELKRMLFDESEGR